LADRLGQDSVSLERVIDAAHCLRLKDRSRLDTVVDDFERRFPQLVVCVYFGVLPPGVTAGEAAIWLCENGLRQTHSGIRNGSWGLIMVLDPAAHRVGVTVGSSLAAYIPQASLEEWLRQQQYHFWHGEYVDGVEGLLGLVAKRVQAAATCRRREVDAQPKPRLGLQRAAPKPKMRPNTVEELL
jgi:uncharacterized membrane protein YgcG